MPSLFFIFMPPQYQTSQQLGDQIGGLIGQTKNFDANSGANINTAIQNKVGGLQPQFQELSNVERTGYQMPVSGMAQYAKTYGPNYQVGKGVAPLEYLNSLMGNFNSQMGRADVLRNTIGQLGGSLKDIAGSVSDMYKNAQDNTFKQIGALQPMYSTLNQREQSQIQLEEQKKQFEMEQMFKEKQLSQQANEAAASRALQHQQMAAQQAASQMNLNAMKQQQQSQQDEQRRQMLARVPDVISTDNSAQMDMLRYLGATPIQEEVLIPRDYSSSSIFQNPNQIFEPQGKQTKVTSYKLPDGRIISVN